MATENVEDTLERIQNHKGVQGVLVVNHEGTPIRSCKGWDDDKTQNYAANISALATKASSMIRELDPQNEMSFLRIRSLKHEIMIAPDKEYYLIVIQDPSTSNSK